MSLNDQLRAQFDTQNAEREHSARAGERIYNTLRRIADAIGRSDQRIDTFLGAGGYSGTIIARRACGCTRGINVWSTPTDDRVMVDVITNWRSPVGFITSPEATNAIRDIIPEIRGDAPCRTCEARVSQIDDDDDICDYCDSEIEWCHCGFNDDDEDDDVAD